MKKANMKKVSWALTLIFNLLTIAQACPTQNQTLTEEVKKQTVDELSKLLPERYAYKEIGRKLERLLQQNLGAGKYDSYDSPIEFSLAVTRDLRSLNSDRHLALDFNPQTESATVNASSPAQPPLTPEERAKRASAFNRQMNYGFKNVKFLNGNIGYLKLDYFDSYLDYSSPVADASMAFFKNSDALIIDLRDNGGGSGEMVNYIAGFFFKDRTLAETSYNRLTDTATEEFINLSTISDLARWDAALDTEKLLKRSSLKQMFTPAELADGKTVNFDFRGAPTSYGFGWFLTGYRGRKVVTHGGVVSGFSSQIMRFPDDKITIIVNTNGKSGTDRIGYAEHLAKIVADAYVPDLAPVSNNQ